jgi:alpha-glucoside transport system substrate-binding protein
MPISRRALLAAGGAATLSTLVGCGGPASQGTVRVHVLWSGDELAAFREVMAEFSRRQRWRVELLTVGDDIGALLESQVGRRTRPDVVLLSLSGLALDHAADLAPVTEAVSRAQLDAFPLAWRMLVSGPSAGPAAGPDLGVWFKVAHKSLVWYRKDVFREHQITPPESVADWLKVNRTLAGRGMPPLGIGAADGWVLTDLFENLLLGQDRRVYQALVPTREPGRSGQRPAPAARWREQPVADALTLLAELVRPDGPVPVLPGGVDRALLLQFQDSLVDVFARRRAAMVPAADFATPVIAQVADPAEVGVFRFPGLPGRPKPLVVGGDLAVLPQPAEAGGKAALAWLASPEAARIWARHGGFISPLTAVGADAYGPAVRPYYDTVLDPATRAALRGEDLTQPLTFDLSDQLTGGLAGGDGQGSWQLLQDFVSRVGRGGDVPAAVGDAVAQFVAAAGGAGSR